ncbi:hypothetical protein [Elizabethkingia ursingii]|uniref:Lipoprotein n=1 Tax=Elizabethkingia ursingii TaxID=1756150 RepID=A0AAJ3NCL6_9FLAO|nr:hypothetical protein [Elizabethkingia ursingii]AQX09840.1 hypothetical protein BBD34_14885 [Elizabethkingia ursingii]OPB75983.1 hypothetical protein BAY32_04255 [Elizabethkingia ursingii]OPB84650.1 hypothetical protein BB021_14935 [Elizabethkingia ursingii]
MKSYITLIIVILMSFSCSDNKITDKKVLEDTLNYLSQRNKNKQVNVFDEITNYKGETNIKLKNLSFLSCKEIFDTGELNFYVLKFNHISKDQIDVDIVNYSTLESFKLKFNNGNKVPQKESLHSDASGRPYMIFSKQLRKKEPYSTDEALQYIDAYPTDSIKCK